MMPYKTNLPLNTNICIVTAAYSMKEVGVVYPWV